MNNTNEHYFKGAAQAKVTQQGATFSAGTELNKGYTYHARLIRNSVEKTQQTGNLFLSKFEIISTNCPTDSPGDQREVKIWASSKSAFGNLRSLLHAVLGYDESADKEMLYGNGKIQNHIEDLLQWAYGPMNPLEDIEVKLDTMLRMAKTIRPGQSAASSYVFHSWRPVIVGTTPEVQAAAFAAVGAK